jgi:hypothetical protein
MAKSQRMVAMDKFSSSVLYEASIKSLSSSSRNQPPLFLVLFLISQFFHKVHQISKAL